MEEKTLKKVLNIFKEFTDKSCPKEELKYAYYNSKRKELVATDTIRLLIAEIDLGFDDSYYLALNRKGNITTGGIEIIGSYNAYREVNRIYPKYENVIPNKLERNEFGVKYKGLKIKDVIVNVGSLTDTETIVAFNKAYDKLNDIDENAKIYLDKYFPDKEPVLIEWKSNLTNTNWKLIFQPISK